MALDATQLLRIATLVDGAPSIREAARAVRTELPGVLANIVDGIDVRGEKAAINVGSRRIFLVESEGHCWHITSDPSRAGAVMLVQD